jgi:hypothetical protein
MDLALHEPSHDRSLEWPVLLKDGLALVLEYALRDHPFRGQRRDPAEVRRVDRFEVVVARLRTLPALRISRSRLAKSSSRLPIDPQIGGDATQRHPLRRPDLDIHPQSPYYLTGPPSRLQA